MPNRVVPARRTAERAVRFTNAPQVMSFRWLIFGRHAEVFGDELMPERNPVYRVRAKDLLRRLRVSLLRHAWNVSPFLPARVAQRVEPDPVGFTGLAAFPKHPTVGLTLRDSHGGA